MKQIRMALKSREVYLNRFPLFRLKEEKLKVLLLKPELDPPLGRDDLYPLLNLLARRAGKQVVRHGNLLASWDPEGSLALEGQLVRQGANYRYRLHPQSPRVLDPRDPQDRETLSRLLRRWLEAGLTQAFPGHRTEGLRVFSQKTYLGGKGWHLLQGAQLDIWVEGDGRALLEVDILHRLEATIFLEEWLRLGNPLPLLARNAYKDGTRTPWEVVRLGDEDPGSIVLESGLSLLEYHQRRGRLEGREPGRVVWLRDQRGSEVPHLTSLLRPVLTLEALAEIPSLGEVPALQMEPGNRLKMARQTARVVAQRVFGLRPEEVEPLKAKAFLLPKPVLKARGGRPVDKPADTFREGVLRPGETGVALLRLDGGRGWPKEVVGPLERVAKASGTSLQLLEAPPLSLDDSPALRQALEGLQKQGASALLVLTPPLSWEERNRLKALALQAGLPSQLLNPPLQDLYRVENALLGLLVKLGWRVVALGASYPAELAVGFDAGGRESLRFGGAACAVAADGGMLGWVLPEAQRGERIPQEVVRDLLEEALYLFWQEKGRLPERVLLLRDGRIPKEEFAMALEGLRKQGIGYDLLSVRKSGAGRIYSVNGGKLPDGLFLPLEEGFLLLTVSRGRGTPRPLKVLREEGDTPLEEVAQQVYHLTRLYPQAAASSPAFPLPCTWPTVWCGRWAAWVCGT